MARDIILDFGNFEELGQELARTLNSVSKEIQTKAFTRAIRTTFASVRGQSKKDANAAYTAHKPKDLKARENVRMGSGKLTFTGRRGFGLVHFKAQPSKPMHKGPPGGVSTQVKKGGARNVRRLPGYSAPFVASIHGGKNLQDRKGQYGLFVRRIGTRKKWEFLFGPSTIQYVRSKDNVEKVEELVNERFPQNLKRELHMILAGIVR